MKTTSDRDSDKHDLVAARAAPTDLDRYDLVERIGSGGAGEVFLARERLGGAIREVCVKRVAVAIGEPQIRALHDEARLLARVRHANVVSLLGVGEERCGTPFLVLELIRGANLRALSKALAALPDASRPATRGLLPDLVAVHVACAVLRGLGAVQRSIPGFVHRDVTPHNVLVSNEGEVKLGDFGIALAADRARCTPPLTVKGKLGYIAPEQLRGEPLDARSDLFAVGVMLYELLTRRKPWGEARGMQELRAIQDGRAEPIAFHRPDLAFALAQNVDRLVANRPADRPADADGALRALAPFSAGDLGSLRLAALLRSLEDFHAEMER
jgi:serine/threonine-protein kinase